MHWVLEHERQGEAGNPGPASRYDGENNDDVCCKSECSSDDDVLPELCREESESEAEMNVNDGSASEDSDSEDDRPAYHYRELLQHLPTHHPFYLPEVTKA